jgi:hypothetical protein
MHNGPRAVIVIVEQNHTGLRLQGGIEPRQRVRGVSSYLDLDEMFHYALIHLPLNGPAAASSEGTCPAAAMTCEALWAAMCFRMSDAD